MIKMMMFTLKSEIKLIVVAKLTFYLATLMGLSKNHFYISK